jgi:hypothetical protein
MRYKIVAIILISFSLNFALQAWARVEAGRVAMHQLRISDPSTRSQLISVPFVKEAISRGRLDGVNINEFTIRDAQGAFLLIDDQSTYILRITEGDCSGSWFLLGNSTVDGVTIDVLNDGVAGALSDLKGNESFAVHALYTLSELFPEEGTFLPAGDIDLEAMQIHFYDGREFKKFWLSNSTITEHVGWTCAENGELVYAGGTVVLPGTSFLVYDPRADATVSIGIQGVVFDTPLHVPVYSGYNFVFSNYNKKVEGSAANSLDNMGLKESGFQGSGGPLADGDKVYTYDQHTGRFGEIFYLNQATGEFSAPSNFEPGDGFVVYNTGEPYLWKAPL